MAPAFLLDWYAIEQTAIYSHSILFFVLIKVFYTLFDMGDEEEPGLLIR
ncbi:MAG: hypothetical protein H0X43_07510 [Nitrosospira sp.]|nr:hypothetical protein [Nitrosospira sp.]